MKNLVTLVSLFSLLFFSAYGGVQISGIPEIPEDLLKINNDPEEKKEICKAINLESAGYNLVGVLHLPTTAMPEQGFPTVVLFHGFRGSKIGGLGKPYRKLAQELVHKGIACVRFDMAGCGDSEGYADSVPIRIYLRNGEDIFNAVSSYPEVDSERMGIAGFSLGCHTALYLARSHHTNFTLASISLWAPIADGGILLKELYERYKADKKSACDAGRDFGLGPLPLVVSSTDVSDLFKIQDHILASTLPDRPKILHLQGEEDNIVSIRHQSLFRCGAPGSMSFRLYEKTGHSLEDSPYSDIIIQEMIVHFLRTL